MRLPDEVEFPMCLHRIN